MNQTQKDFILKVLMDKTMTLKYSLKVLGLTYRDHQIELKKDVEYQVKYRETKSGRNLLTDSEIKNVIDKYRSGSDLEIVFKDLGIPYSKHKSTIKENKEYSELLDQTRIYRNMIGQLIFLKELESKNSINKVLKELGITQNRFKRWIQEPDFKLSLKKRGNINIGNFVDPNLRNRDWLVINKSKLSIDNLLKFNGEVVGRICDYCYWKKPLSHFYHNSKNNPPYYSTCIHCVCLKNNKPLPNEYGEVRKGIVVKKRNVVNNLTERRCTKCQNMMSTKFFRYDYKGIHVCDSCFDSSIPFDPNRSGEFNKKGEIIREYDNLNYVIRKRCNGECQEMLDLKEFTKNKNNIIDGTSFKCRSCQKEEREKLKNKNLIP
jgi:hypothetical protein